MPRPPPTAQPLNLISFQKRDTKKGRREKTLLRLLPDNKLKQKFQTSADKSFWKGDELGFKALPVTSKQCWVTSSCIDCLAFSADLAS